MKDKTVDFFIVGAGKSGTSAMHSYLRQHPDIYMPPRKEINYFGSDLTWLRKRPYISNTPIEDYLAHFSGWQGEHCIGEASVAYLISTQAPHEIKAFNPDAQIIIMLRNPIDAMYAAYSQARYSGKEDQSTFAEALATVPARREGKNLPPYASMKEMMCYLDSFSYSTKVAHYFDVFGRDKVHIIIYDDFKRDTASVYHNTLAFLGVDTSFEPTFEIVNSNKVARSPELRDYFWRRPLPVRVARKLLPKTLRIKGSQWIRKANSRTVARPPMDVNLRRTLQADMTPEVEKLSELLGRDLSHWVQA